MYTVNLKNIDKTILITNPKKNHIYFLSYPPLKVDLHPLLNLSLTPANPSLKTPSFFFYDPSFGSFSSSPELNISLNLSLMLLKVPLILSFIYPKSGLGISMFSKVLKKLSSFILMLSITCFISQLDLDCI